MQSGVAARNSGGEKPQTTQRPVRNVQSFFPQNKSTEWLFLTTPKTLNTFQNVMTSVTARCDALMSCDESSTQCGESLAELRRLRTHGGLLICSGTRDRMVAWVQKAVEICRDSVACVEDAVMILAALLGPTETLTLSAQVHDRIGQVVRLHGSSLDALRTGGIEVVRRCLRVWAENIPLQAWTPFLLDQPGAWMDTAVFVADLVTRLPCVSPVLEEGCWLPCAVEGLRVISRLLVSDDIRAAVMPAGQRILCVVAGHQHEIELLTESLKVARELALRVDGHAALHPAIHLIRGALSSWAAVSSTQSDDCVLAAMACLRTLATSGTLRAEMMDLVPLGCTVMDLKVHSIRIVDECISWLWNLAYTLPDAMRSSPDKVLLTAVRAVISKGLYYSKSLCVVKAAMGFLRAMTACEGNLAALAGMGVSLAALQAVTDFQAWATGRVDILDMQRAAVCHLESMHTSGCLVTQFRSEDAVLKLVDHVATCGGRAIEEAVGTPPSLYTRSVGLSLWVLLELVPLLIDMDAVAVAAQLVAQDIVVHMISRTSAALVDPALALCTVLEEQQVRAYQ